MFNSWDWFCQMHFSVVLTFVADSSELPSELKNVSASSNADELWTIYKNHFNRNFKAEEDQERFNIFRANVKKIIEHNERSARGEESYTLGINQFTDRKESEITC